MIEILRNLMRRKLRSALTISGIVIGIFALTTMGAMAEHFNSLLNIGVQYAGSAIHVGPPAEQPGALIPLGKADELAHVPGVTAVYPTYQVQAEPGGSSMQFGPPDLVMNEQTGTEAYGMPAKTFASGRDIASGSRGEVVLGGTIATNLGKHTGQTVDLPVPPKDAPPGFVTHSFTVVGVLAKSGNTIDTFAYVNDTDARMLVADTLPANVRAAVDTSTVAQGFNVFAARGTSLAQMDAIAQRINQDVAGVSASKPSAMVAAFKSTGATFTAVTTGAALLALVIGGLSVVNTMIMAVTERVREIGLKKALGAHTVHVMAEFLLEASLIGLIGGLAGYGLGVLLTTIVDRLGSSGNLDIFLVTPQLTAIALGFAIAMATLAGIIPAFRAARLDPVTALRSN